ncbi:phosphotransferase [Ovoidimarina sediminis]|uniref:phosphotransferase n=1 Tax=Ovoidimarina sediminis TaxID=3079856 RepID=UPI002906E4F3|nr:phosphotransferase [Rhodophyticola sp. MJ-SS7]MDU8943174.1 phosphotransferase [Rhodophyticola sp. MJ-SS7]
MPGFVKTYGDAAVAAEAIRRAAALRAGGVDTPYGRLGATPHEVVFDRIDGESGFPLMREAGEDLLRCLAWVHACDVPDLPAYDPLKRIRPRIGLATADPVRAVLGEKVPTGTATLHGDLHVRQFVRESSGRVWIVDLDDMALGPPEADLANCAAHVMTAEECGKTLWGERVGAMWRGLGMAFDADIFFQFLRFALVRRHLKLREAGRPDCEEKVVAYLRGSSNFSIL